MRDDLATDPTADHHPHEWESEDGVAIMPFEEQRQVHELLSQETRHHIIRTILGHPAYLPTIAEFAFYISKSKRVS